MHEGIPSEVTTAISGALAAPHLVVEPLAGGTNRRTYRVQCGEAQWVARVERAPAPSLARAVDAQARASAAGLRTPVTLAHDLTATADGPYRWSVETFVPGRPWLPGALDAVQTLAAAADLGRQLRRLHAVAVDGFGDLPPRPYPVYPSFAAGAAPDAVGPIAAVYAALAGSYDGPPCLRKGDYAGDNLLVEAAGHTTIIDWEWARGLDPAADVAAWLRFTPEEADYAALLVAYEPDEPRAFRQRVWSNQVVHRF